MELLDRFFRDLKMILYLARSRNEVAMTARTRLDGLVDEVCDHHAGDAEYLLTACRQRLKMLEHIAGASPILRELEDDLERAMLEASRRRSA